MSTKLQRYNKTIPSLYNPQTNRLVGGLLGSWASTSEDNTASISNAKDQIFLQTATSRYLTSLGKDKGVSRPLLIPLPDADLRKLIIKMSYAPKNIRKTMYEVLDIFWGPTYSRANVTSSISQTYNFGTPAGITGTVSLTKNSVSITGAGTFFTSELAIGDFIKLTSADNTLFVKVINIVSDTILVVDTPAVETISGSAVKLTSKNLTILIDAKEEQDIFLNPKFFLNTLAVTCDEVSSAINDIIVGGTAESIKSISNSDRFINLRTNTPGLQGNIQVTGGTANALFSFSTSKFTVDDLFRSTIIYEINPREIVLKVPNLVAKLTRALKGAYHTNTPITGDITAIDNTLKTITIDLSEAVSTDQLVGQKISQLVSEFEITSNTSGTTGVVLSFDTGDDLSFFTLNTARLIDVSFPNSYLFDPKSNFLITGKRTIILQNIAVGDIVSVLTVDDASDIPNEPGYLCFNFGKNNEENLVPYISRPNNSTIIVNSTHTFLKAHSSGDMVNYVVNSGYNPKKDGTDYAFYVTGTLGALQIVQDLIAKLRAAGVILRWIVDYPQYRFEC